MTSSLDALPERLKQAPRWVLWKREGKKKTPINPLTNKPISYRNPNAIFTFDDACTRARQIDCDGIGLVLDDSGLTVVDIDNCVENGAVLPWAKTILDRLDTFTEISISGTGVHAFLAGGAMLDRAVFSVAGNKIEVYQKNRFIAVTGHHLPGIHSAEIRSLHPSQLVTDIIGLSAPQQPKTTSPASFAPPMSLDDESVIINSRRLNPAKFDRLWAGDFVGMFDSQSEADLSLANMLAKSSSDEPQIDRIFRSSALFRPEKWGRKLNDSTYGESTIRRAIKNVSTPRSTTLPRPKPTTKQKPPHTNQQQTKPVITIDSNNRDSLRHKAVDAIRKYVTTTVDDALYSRGLSIVRVVAVHNNAAIVPVTPVYMNALLHRVADWRRESKREPTGCSPPKWLAEELLEDPSLTKTLPPIDSLSVGIQHTPKRCSNHYCNTTKNWSMVRPTLLPQIATNNLSLWFGQHDFLTDTDRLNAIKMLTTNYRQSSLNRSVNVACVTSVNNPHMAVAFAHQMAEIVHGLPVSYSHLYKNEQVTTILDRAALRGNLHVIINGAKDPAILNELLSATASNAHTVSTTGEQLPLRLAVTFCGYQMELPRGISSTALTIRLSPGLRRPPILTQATRDAIQQEIVTLDHIAGSDDHTTNRWETFEDVLYKSTQKKNDRTTASKGDQPNGDDYQFLHWLVCRFGSTTFTCRDIIGGATHDESSTTQWPTKLCESLARGDRSFCQVAPRYLNEITSVTIDGLTVKNCGRDRSSNTGQWRIETETGTQTCKT